MSVQSSYSQSPEPALAGMPAYGASAPENQIDSGLCSTRKLVSVAIANATALDVYEITINGTVFTYTADGATSTAEVTVGLKNAINAGDEPVVASGTDTPLLIEGTNSEDFTYADSVTGTGTLTETVLVTAGQEIPFGVYVCQDDRAVDDLGAADYAVRLPRLSTDITGGLRMGVALRDKAREANDGAASFRADTMIPVMREGACWVQVDAAVAVGGAVYVRYAAGGNGLGSFGASAGSSERALLPGAVYRTAAGIDGLALVELNK